MTMMVYDYTAEFGAEDLDPLIPVDRPADAIDLSSSVYRRKIRQRVAGFRVVIDEWCNRLEMS